MTTCVECEKDRGQEQNRNDCSEEGFDIEGTGLQKTEEPIPRCFTITGNWLQRQPGQRGNYRHSFLHDTAVNSFHNCKTFFSDGHTVTTYVVCNCHFKVLVQIIVLSEPLKLCSNSNNKHHILQLPFVQFKLGRLEKVQFDLAFKVNHYILYHYAYRQVNARGFFLIF